MRVVTQRIAVTAGSTVTIGPETFPTADPCTIAAIPTSGGTLLVEYQVAPSGTWLEWPAGAVATNTVYLLTGPVYALRFTATTKDGTAEIAQ